MSNTETKKPRVRKIVKQASERVTKENEMILEMIDTHTHAEIAEVVGLRPFNVYQRIKNYGLKRGPVKERWSVYEMVSFMNMFGSCSWEELAKAFNCSVYSVKIKAESKGLIRSGVGTDYRYSGRNIVLNRGKYSSMSPGKITLNQVDQIVEKDRSNYYNGD